ncbi:MAG: diguanylate cyclase [Clostridia bacterium]|nr:diguanylate cyclase [Clostridia bacterium]
MNNTLIYIQSQVLCIILLLTMLVFDLKYNQKQKPSSLHGIYILGVLAGAFDILRAISYGKAPLIWLGHMSNILYLSVFGFIGFLWLSYCNREFGLVFWKNLRIKLLYMIPAVLVLGMVITSSSLENIYVIDAGGVYSKGDMYFIPFVSYLYIALTGIVALICRNRSRYDRDRSKFATFAAFSLPALAVLIYRIFMPYGGLALETYVVLLSVMILYINNQHRQILIDSLTKLPNRFGMDAELAEQLGEFKKDKNDLFTVIVCDLDDFKQINDSFGHMEGDRALKIIADILNRVSSMNNGSAYRMGGDEFVIITDDTSAETTQNIYNQIAEELKNVSFRDDFTLGMSLGAASYDGSVSVTELLGRADMQLYKTKKEKKVGR